MKKTVDIAVVAAVLSISVTTAGQAQKLPEGAVVGISINSSGNVGVGTTTPTEKLEVNGDLKVTGAAIRNADGLAIVETNKSDWLRVNPEHTFPGTAMYGPVSVGNGGLSVGNWTKYPKGQMETTKDTYLATTGGRVGVATTTPYDNFEMLDGKYKGKYPLKLDVRSGFVAVGAIVSYGSYVFAKDFVYAKPAVSAAADGPGGTIDLKSITTFSEVYERVVRLEAENKAMKKLLCADKATADFCR